MSTRALHLREFSAVNTFVPAVFLRRCPSSTTSSPMFVASDNIAIFLRNKSYEMISTACMCNIGELKCNKNKTSSPLRLLQLHYSSKNMCTNLQIFAV